MIEAKLIYRARCDVCRKPFGPEHETEAKPTTQDRFSVHFFWMHETQILFQYDGPHVCPTCETKKNEQSLKIVNGCLDQSLHDNLIGMGIKKQKGEE